MLARKIDARRKAGEMRHRPPGQAVQAPCAGSIVDDLQVKAHLCPPMLVSHCFRWRRCSHPFPGDMILGQQSLPKNECAGGYSVAPGRRVLT